MSFFRYGSQTTEPYSRTELDSFHFKTLYSRECSSSPFHSILGNCVPALNIDGTLPHGGLALVLGVKLRSSIVTCVLIQYLFGRSGSGYIRRRSQSMAINATDQGERNNFFFFFFFLYIRSPFLLKSSMFIKTALCGHYNHVKIWLKTLLLSVLFS